MIRPGIFALLLMSMLAACGTPQQQCIAQNTRELRVVDRLIAEVQGNLARGYALRETTVTQPEWQDCLRKTRNKQGKTVLVESLCLEDEAVTVQKPEPIDPAAEKRKLAGLQEQRRGLAQRAEGAIAACRAQYPD